MNQEELCRELIDAIADEQWDRAEDAAEAVFSNFASDRLEQERASVAQEWLGDKL